MMSDVRVVMWKELRELVRQRSTFVSAAFLMVLFGAIFPANAGATYLSRPETIFNLGILPFAVIVAFIADAFAGERERHTLESLLATRLPDRAILLGKIGAAVLWGWALTLVEATVAFVVVNLTARQGLVLYDARILAGGLGLGLLVAILMSSLGVLVSLRAATVKQAQQILSAGVGIVIALSFAGGSLLPDATRASLLRFLGTTGSTELMLLGGAILALLDALLLVACLARFRRARLILD